MAPRPGRRGAVGVAAVLVLAGFMLTSNALLAGGLDQRQAQDLPSLVDAESDRVADLAAEVEGLRSQVDALTDAATRGGGAGDADVTDLDAVVSGVVPVVGPGVTVRLTDAPTNGPRPDWATNDDLVVHQQDLQAVINALWTGGAEAMMLQDQRVTPTSAYRCVGNVLLLHGRHYSPPFVVRAIGEPDELVAALDAAPGVRTYRDWVEAVNLGYSQTVEERISMPAFEGSLDLEHAGLPAGVEPWPDDA